jgi:crossover junction endonuclease MUS81
MAPPADEDCANPLLLSWVKEWLETARERNSKGVTVYKKAYDSLKSCPLPFSHPSETQQLTGFGPKLCDRLTTKLKEYCEEHGLSMPEMPHKTKKKGAKNDDNEDGTEAATKKARQPKPYVPKLRSGAYALILALSTLDKNAPNGITKAQTIELAQPHCDSSFSAPDDPTKFYTAWSSMKTLIDKDLVYEKGRPTRKYALTEEGWDVAKRILKSSDPSQGRLDTFTAAEAPPKPSESNKNFDDSFDSPNASPARPTAAQASESLPRLKATVADIIPQGEAIKSTSSLPTFTPINLPPGSFTVELVLDIREVRAKQDRDYMQNNLTTADIKPIMRALELGDILWVAKVHDPNLLSRLGAEGDEILLDWIVERKRLDDLVGSIKDGRFHEQKFRLAKSGIKNVIYIIEEISMNADHFQKYEEAVESAIASTQVVNGYFVKKTQRMDDTIRYLASLTKMLKARYESKPLSVIPTNVITAQNYLFLLENLRKTKPREEYHITYSAFASLSSKSESLTLRDVYLKMLMCTRGVTGEKALEIQKRWKTPRDFIEAYEKCGDGDQGRKRKIELVSNEMGNLVGRKKIAKVLSGKIAEVWGGI